MYLTKEVKYVLILLRYYYWLYILNLMNKNYLKLFLSLPPPTSLFKTDKNIFLRIT